MGSHGKHRPGLFQTLRSILGSAELLQAPPMWSGTRLSRARCGPQPIPQSPPRPLVSKLRVEPSPKAWPAKSLSLLTSSAPTLFQLWARRAEQHHSSLGPGRDLGRNWAAGSRAHSTSQHRSLAIAVPLSHVTHSGRVGWRWGGRTGTWSCLFRFSYEGGCEVISQMISICISQMTNEVEHLRVYFLPVWGGHFMHRFGIESGSIHAGRQFTGL